MRAIPEAWTIRDSAAAQRQGWDVFQCTPIASGKEIYEIERDDERGIFASDNEAITFVIEQASRGDRLALKALYLHNTPTDYEHIYTDLFTATKERRA